MSCRHFCRKPSSPADADWRPGSSTDGTPGELPRLCRVDRNSSLLTSRYWKRPVETLYVPAADGNRSRKVRDYCRGRCPLKAETPWRCKTRGEAGRGIKGFFARSEPRLHATSQPLLTTGRSVAFDPTAVLGGTSRFFGRTMLTRRLAGSICSRSTKSRHLASMAFGRAMPAIQL